MSQCEECGKDFFETKSNQKYCSADCRMRRWQRDNPKNEKLKTEKQCRCCGSSFSTSDSRKVYCSDECKIKHRNSIRPTTKESDRQCPMCGGMFKPLQVRGVGRMCCSDVCTLEWRKGKEAADRLKKKKAEQARLENIIYQRKLRSEYPDYMRNATLKKNYGITLERYDQMYTEQDGKCAICGNPETIMDNKAGRLRRLAVDHDHDTGAVRRLLCTGCNQGIGNLKEDPTIMQAALDYLRRHQT